MGPALHVRHLFRRGSLLACGCGARFPILDGIPIVLRDLAGWAASEGPSALCRGDVPREVVELLAVDGASRRNRRLASVYGTAPSSPFFSWLTAFLDSAPGPLLEVGSGLGHGRSVRLDLNLSLLRAAGSAAGVTDSSDGACLGPGCAIVADAADPPFLAASFATIVVANVLDSCAQPALVLAQSDALLAPEGEIVVTCAFAFDDGITPPEAQFTSEALERAMRGEAPFGDWPLGCRLSEEPLDLEWRLRIGERTEHVHRVRVLRARPAR